jgi:AraC-like DNA-binding protein
MVPGKDRADLSVAAGILSQLVRYMGYLKLDIDAVLLACGIDPAVTRTPDLRIPYEKYLAVEEESASLSGDPFFGLHMGEWVEPGNYSILGYLMMNSATLGQAFGMADRYFRLLGNAIGSRGLLGLGTVKIIYEAPKTSVAVSRHCFENLIASCVTMMRTLTGISLYPVEVGFEGNPGLPMDEYQRVFGCPVIFGSRHNYLVLPRRYAAIPVLQPNPQLLAHFEQYALGLLEADETTAGRVADIVRTRMGKGQLSVSATARELGMSVRSLQGRLREEGTSFSGLVEKTRLQLAKRQLERNSSIEEIALLLGYSETSAFSKAFKKLEGQNPSEYRAGCQRQRIGTAAAG